MDKVPEPPLAAIDLSEIRFAKTLAALHYLAFGILMLANLARQLAQSLITGSFARTWLNKLKGRNIRVNVLRPGQTDTSGFPATRQGDEGDVRIPDPAGKDGSS